MKIKNMSARNFMALGDVSVNFERKGLALIEGINNDSPSSTSNGAGKSNIFEALYWGLYGKTKRGVTGDAVVNRFVGKDCSVSVTFEAKGICYEAVRTRKADKDGNSFCLKVLPSGGDLTAGTTRETQVLLDAILGMDADTFGKIAHFGQGDVRPFADLKDSELKAVFEQALGLTYLSAHQAKTKAHLSEIQDVRRTLDVKRTLLEREYQHADEQQARLESVIAELDKRMAEDKKGLLSEMADARSEIKKRERRIDEMRRKAATLESASATQVGKLKVLEDNGRKLADRLNTVRYDLDACRITISQKKRDIEAMRTSAARAENRIGKPCRECARPFTPAEIKPFVEGIAVKVSDAEKELSGLEADLKEKEAYYSELTALKRTLDAESGKVADIKDRLAELWQLKGALSADIKAVSTLKTMASALKGRIERLEGGEKYRPELEKIIDAKRKTLEKLEALNLRAQEKDKEIETASRLVEILSNGGLKSYVFDNITPELNRAIAKYSKILDDIEIEVSTVKKLKSGEFREKFDIKVRNPYGAGDYAANSGGEKQKVNLAIALGFNEVMRAMAADPVNVLFLDEPFESLDGSSSERVVELCKLIADDACVFVVTHQADIKDLVPDRYEVIKTNGISTIK